MISIALTGTPKLSSDGPTSALRPVSVAGRSMAKPAVIDNRSPGTLLLCGATEGDAALVAEALAGAAGFGLRHYELPATAAGYADGLPSLTRVEALALADIVLLVIDAGDPARRGQRDLIIRHHLSGRGGLVVALTGLDQSGDSRVVFELFRADLAALCEDGATPPVVPLAVRSFDPGRGGNAAASSPSWFDGPTLRAAIEAEAARLVPRGMRPFRLAVDTVDQSRPEAPTVAGTVCQGSIAIGERVRILPGGMISSVAGLARPDAKAVDGRGLPELHLTLAAAPGALRPGLIVMPADRPCEVTDRFEAVIVRVDGTPLLPGRNYGLTLAGQAVCAALAWREEPGERDMVEAHGADRPVACAIDVGHVTLDAPVAFDVETNALSCFTLTDLVTGRMLGFGRIRRALRRADNIHWQALATDRNRRAALKAQKPLVVWMTGLSGAGKSTIANLVEQKLVAAGRHTFLLDGDNVRHGLNRDLGFTEPERVENIRRVAEVARLMSDAGLIVLCAFISPFRSDRQMARKLMEAGEFLEVHVKASVELAESRDTKGLYRKARAGELKNFTGIDSPYEAPDAPEIALDTSVLSVEDAADLLVQRIVHSLQGA